MALRTVTMSEWRLEVLLEVEQSGESVAEICRMRRAHPRWGAGRIHGELLRAGLVAPAESTIHQALRRNHLVADQPRRSKAFTRFEREVTNDLYDPESADNARHAARPRARVKRGRI